jgi:hypothetical protein
LAGLGICVQSDGFLPTGLSELPRSSGLPELGHIEFVVAGSGRTLRGPANALATAILDNADRLLSTAAENQATWRRNSGPVRHRVF